MEKLSKNVEVHMEDMDLRIRGFKQLVAQKSNKGNRPPEFSQKQPQPIPTLPLVQPPKNQQILSHQQTGQT